MSSNFRYNIKMKHPDYLEIIQKHIPDHSSLLPLYVSHVTLVTALALEIGQSLNLTDEQLDFIEEASMLHDIGIIKVDAKKIWCHGDQPYISHGHLGKEIIEAEGFPKHARVCERHTGVGITKEEIIENQLPLPEMNLLPETIEEKVIAYADKFFSKNPEELFTIKKTAEITANLSKFGEEKVQIFLEWHKQFQPKKYEFEKKHNLLR